MRTLKKVLALSIVLATLFSLTAFAAYTDEAKIDENCVDDVNLLNALNVMQGDAEGTFRPEGTITRAEAAKMVYVVRTGGKTDADSWKGSSVFSDVPSGAWYEGYVNYCASLGIISGVGNNKFNPNGNVTGTELAKMLLVVSGYKADIQGYTGANWTSNVLNDAQEAGLFEDYDWAFSAAAPRQWAAKMFANAINLVKVATYPAGSLTISGNLADGRTVGEKYFGLKTATGIAMANNNVDLTSAGLNTNTTSKLGSTSFTYNVPYALLGQEITVVYKDNGTVTNALDAGDKVYSVFATGATKVVEITKADGEVDGTELTIDALNDGDEVDYAGIGFTAIYYGGAAHENCIDNAALTHLFNNSTDKVKLIVDEDDVIQYAFVEEAAYAIVKEIDVANGKFVIEDAAQQNVSAVFAQTGVTKTTLASNFNFVDTVKAGDVVKISYSIETGKKIYTISKVTPVTGTISARSTDTFTATIGGKSYTVGNMAIGGFSAMPTLAAAKGKTLYVYTDGTYAIYVGYEGVTAATEISSNFCYVISAGKTTVDKDANGYTIPTVTLGRVTVLLADGTTGTYNYLPEVLTDAVEPAYDADLNPDFYQRYNFDTPASHNGKVYQYVLKNDVIYFLSSPTAIYGVSYDQDLSADANKFTSTNGRFGTYLTNDNTYFFYADTTNKVYKVIKAADLKNGALMTAGTTTYVTADNGLSTIAFGVVTSANTGSVTVAQTFAIVTAAPYDALVDDEEVKMVSVVLSNGDKANLVIDEKGTMPEAGKLYTVVGDDDVYTFTLSAGVTISAATDKVVMIDGVLYNITSATKVYYVKSGALTTTSFAMKGSKAHFSADGEDLLILYVEYVAAQ